LPSGATASIVVRALSSTFLPGFADSAAFNVAIPAALQAPTGVTATVLSPTSARISWGPVTGADLGFQVFQKGSPNILIGTTAAGVTTVIATGLTPGTTDQIFVQADSSFLTAFQANSALVSVIMPATVGGPVVTVSQVTQSTAVLSWPAVAGVDGYRVYLVVNGQRALLWYGGNVASPSVKLVGMTRATTYTFIIEAFKGFVFTDTSVTFTTLS
jgi:hypothetical protein